MHPRPTRPAHRRRLALLRPIASPFVATLLAAGGLAACSSDGSAEPTGTAGSAASVATVAVTDAGAATSTATAGAPRPVVLDYSPTVSDAGALLYLATNPDVDLVAVVVPGTGEADCAPGVRTTRALLALAGDAAVPVACGRDAPLVGDRDWPAAWRAEASTWGEGVLPEVDGDQPIGDAEQLLTSTIEGSAAPVTIVAVGPLTNLGAVLGGRPELAERIGRVVIMGGAVHVPGNVDAAPRAEWNLYIDPEAARRVLGAGLELELVPLDATNSVPWTERILHRMSTLDGSVARAEHAMLSTRPSLDGVYLWDELAAIATVHPELLTFEDTRLRIDDDGATEESADGALVRVAVDADAAAIVDEFLRTLNGGTLPEVPPLTQRDAEYLVALSGASSDFVGATGGAYELLGPGGTTTTDPRAVAHAFADRLFDATDALERAVRAATPPPELRSAHDAYLAAIRALAERRVAVVAEIDAAGATEVGELLEVVFSLAAADVAEFQSTCMDLQGWSFLRDGPRLCPPDGG